MYHKYYFLIFVKIGTEVEQSDDHSPTVASGMAGTKQVETARWPGNRDPYITHPAVVSCNDFIRCFVRFSTYKHPYIRLTHGGRNQYPIIA
jgi:hypothetical protein